MRPIAVFDTNVWLSGIGWKGKPFECLELARNGAIQVVTCQKIVDELTETLQNRFAFSGDQIAETLADLLSFAQVVKITNQLRVVSGDPDDDKVLEYAVAGNATHIVSGDRKHLRPIGQFQNIPIVTPAEFLKAMS